jgi:hypothetical protein
VSHPEPRPRRGSRIERIDRSVQPTLRGRHASSRHDRRHSAYSGPDQWPQDFEDAFVAITKAEAQAVIVQGLFDPHRAIILELAAKHRLPIMSGNRATAAAGGLISYSATL